MNETIKKLREELHLPLKTALELVKNYGEDFEICKEKYHQKQILSICEATECDIDTARDHYIKYGYDVEKAVKKIRDRVVKIRVDESIPPKYKYGFQLFSLDAESKFSNENDNCIFIHWEDFEIILEAFVSVFPIEDDIDKQENFDHTGSNYFRKHKVRQIISYIRKMNFDDEKVKQFAKKVGDWLEKQLKYAKTIEVYGTL